MNTAARVAVMNSFNTAQRICQQNQQRHYQQMQKRHRKNNSGDETPVETLTPEQKEIKELKQRLTNVGIMLRYFNEKSWFEKMRYNFGQDWIDYCLKA